MLKRLIDEHGWPLLFGGVLLVLWFGVHLIFPLIPTPLKTLEAFYIQVVDGNMVEATINGLYAIFIGYFIAIVVGISAGLAMGLDENTELFMTPYVYGLYAIPLSAIVPAFIIWFGTGLQVRVVAVLMFAIFPIIINTSEGAKNVPADLLEVSRSFGAGSLFIIKNVVLYYQIPYISTGLRLGFGRAIRGLVITELLVSVTGFGLIINQWSAGLRMEGVFSVAIFLMSLGVLSTWLLQKLEDSFVHWEITEV